MQLNKDKNRQAMERTERFYKICKELDKKRPVTTAKLLPILGEISRYTLRRDINYLIDHFNAPIEYDRASKGWRYIPGSEQFELPGLWFSPSEAQALVTLQHLLQDLQPGLLEPYLRPVQTRIGKLLQQSEQTLDEVGRRIRILSQNARIVPSQYFELSSYAVLARKRLSISHYHRERDETTVREISPQRLVHYRDNWYLDAYDHLRSSLRTFSLATLTKVTALDKAARNIADNKLNQELADSYGIFAGKQTQTAILRFTPYRARWVSQEQWHPRQKSRFEGEYYLLEIPYADDRELLMDILKHGSEVEVLAPKNLRARVRETLKEAHKNYTK
ncbi:helix-turn-helix transcriptional regulator [Sulfuriflexus sp.]|uniref:helix-turn-helix transcriptional regulator n=1 Tax=Sulfuriflexus sp. TaxID=2015443 RepID=UPI0028CCCFF1|nr:WYL domain-containing protein [Sulfuriflexus sp.]MDT8403249.1 WYL domain-containing protein [Sulfuriflexus sp.]